MRIREATIDDCDGIATVHVRTWQAAYRGIVPDEVLDAMDVGVRAKAWRDNWIADPEKQTWVSIEDGAITGLLTCGPALDDPQVAPGELYAIYVDAAHWGDGTGTALMVTANGWLSARYASATLWTLERNGRARRFYEKHGWAFDGTTKQEDRDTFVLDEVRYRVSFENQ